VKLVHPEGTDQFFAFRVDGGERYELNEVAYEMLRRIDGIRDLSTVTAEIEAEFEQGDNVRSDLEALVRQLVDEGLAELSQDSSTTAGGQDA